MKGNYGRGQNIWRPPLHKSRRLSRFKHLHALKSSYRDGNSSTLLTKSCFLSFSALHLFPPSSFPSLFVSCFFFFFFFVSFGLTKIPRTGGQAGRQLNRKRSFRNRNKKTEKTSTRRKETHKTKSKERREALQNTSTVNCLFLGATDRRNKHNNISSLLLHSFLASFTCFCLSIFLVSFLSFHRRSFCGVPARTSPTNDDSSVTNINSKPPSVQENSKTHTQRQKSSCRTAVHGTDTTDSMGKRGNPDNVHRNWKKIRKSQKQRKMLSKLVNFPDNYIFKCNKFD